jgi:hypothetical protein
MPILVVMPALVAGIHVLNPDQVVDGRDKPGHDVERPFAVSKMRIRR